MDRIGHGGKAIYVPVAMYPAIWAAPIFSYHPAILIPILMILSESFGGGL